MDAERWQQIRELFRRALELEGNERAAFLEQECAGDDAARDQIDLLLASLEESGDFLEQPAVAHRLSYEGARIGPYELVKRIGRGGMGMVYLAVRADEEFQRRVAVKLLQPGEDSEEMIRRFRDERQILAALDHPNIAKLLDGGTTPEGLPYLVMEYIEGHPIDEYCDLHGLDTGARLQLFRQVCSAVQFAHQNLVVHRDLKPANILVAEDGIPRLLDFGIAKLLNPELSRQRNRPTVTAMRLMTPEYASPEQLRGDPVNTASDVYSLGVLLYKLVTGQVPFEIRRTSPADMVRAVCEDEPQAPSAIVLRERQLEDAVSRSGAGRLHRRLRGDVDNIVLKAMRKEPVRRYVSVEQFLEDIRRHLDGRPVLARKDTLAYRAGKFMRRHRFGVAAVAAFVTACLGFGLVMAVQRAQIAGERDRVEKERNRAASALEILVDLFDSADPATMTKADGETVSAREILDRGALMIRENLAEEPELQAEMMMTLGSIYSRLGLYDSAISLLESALRIHRRPGGEWGARTAENLDALALAFYQRGDIETAERHYGEALEIRRDLSDDDPLAIAASLTNLADIHSARGDYGEAAKLYERSLVTRKEHLGPENIDVSTSLSSLANVLVELGRREEAESHHREALEIRSKLVGSDHLAIAESQNNLAGILWDQGELAEARSLYEAALETLRVRLGENHWEFVNTLINLGFLHQGSGQLEAAAACFRQVLENYHPDHRRGREQRARAAKQLASVLQAQGRSDEAEDLFQQAIAVLREQGKDSNPLALGATLTDFAILLQVQGDFETGETVAREALQLLAQIYAEDHSRIAVAETVLAGSLTLAGRFAEAEELLLHSYPILASGSGQMVEVQEREALRFLVAVYGALERPQAAQRYRELQSAVP